MVGEVDLGLIPVLLLVLLARAMLLAMPTCQYMLEVVAVAAFILLEHQVEQLSKLSQEEYALRALLSPMGPQLQVVLVGVQVALYGLMQMHLKDGALSIRLVVQVHLIVAAHVLVAVALIMAVVAVEAGFVPMARITPAKLYCIAVKLQEVHHLTTIQEKLAP